MQSSDVISAVLILLLLLQTKHLICDGPLQTKTMVREKGHYGSPMGLLHAALHGVGTLIVFAVIGADWLQVVVFAIVDMVIHYHVDFAKERLVRTRNWTVTDSQFWSAMIADQYLHAVTYLGFAAYTYG